MRFNKDISHGLQRMNLLYVLFKSHMIFLWGKVDPFSMAGLFTLSFLSKYYSLIINVAIWDVRLSSSNFSPFSDLR